MGNVRILVTGDRNWTDEQTILAALVGLKAREGTAVTIIHGAARGADTIAGRIAKELGFDVEAYPADWNKYGKAAGPIRNKQMLREGKPQGVLAFHDDLFHSRGTRNMVEISKSAGLPVACFHSYEYCQDRHVPCGYEI